MARKPDVQYIRFYTDGSAARQLEPKAPKRKSSLPKPRPQKKLAIYVDPLALGGILVSAVLLVMMIAGSVELFQAKQALETMQKDLSTLTVVNAEKWETYESGYDLELIERSALALGMVPAEEAQNISVSVPMPEPVRELTLWEKLGAFLEGLFA